MKGNNNEQEVYVNVKKNGIYFLEHFKIPENSSVENWLLDNHPEYEFIDCGDYEDEYYEEDGEYYEEGAPVEEASVEE